MILLLEVRHSNVEARAFYEGRFQELYRGRNYYRRPVEDALVMVRHICEHDNGKSKYGMV